MIHELLHWLWGTLGFARAISGRRIYGQRRDDAWKAARGCAASRSLLYPDRAGEGNRLARTPVPGIFMALLPKNRRRRNPRVPCRLREPLQNFAQSLRYVGTYLMAKCRSNAIPNKYRRDPISRHWSVLSRALPTPFEPLPPPSHPLQHSSPHAQSLPRAWMVPGCKTAGRMGQQGYTRQRSPAVLLLHSSSSTDPHAHGSD